MNGQSTRSGDKCECGLCRGHMVVYKTRINFSQGIRIRYLRCQQCGHLPAGNKWIVPIEFAPARSSK